MAATSHLNTRSIVDLANHGMSTKTICGIVGYSSKSEINVSKLILVNFIDVPCMFNLTLISAVERFTLSPSCSNLSP